MSTVGIEISKNLNAKKKTILCTHRLDAAFNSPSSQKAFSSGSSAAEDSSAGESIGSSTFTTRFSSNLENVVNS
jgi:hypothetical protein